MAANKLRIKVDQEIAEANEENYSRAASWLIFWSAFAFAGIVGFSRLSYGLLLPAIRTDLGGSYSLVGLVGTANFVGYLLGSLAIPLGISRYISRTRLNLVALSAMGLLMMFSASSLDLLQLGFWRSLIGFSSALANILTISLALERIRPSERGFATGLMWVGSATGIVISGLIAPVVISTGWIFAWRIIWVIMGGLILVAAFGTYRIVLSSPVPDAVTSPQSQNAKTSPIAAPPTASQALAALFQPKGLLFLTLTNVGFGFGYIIFSTFFITLLVAQYGFAQEAAGLVWAGMGLMAALGGLFWGKVIDRWPNGFVQAAGLSTGAISSLAVLTGQPFLMLVGTALFGLFIFGPSLIITVLVKKAISAELYPLSYSFLTTLYALGQLAGPVVGGIAVDWLGFAAAIGLSAVLLGSAAISALVYAFIHRQD